MELTSTPHCGHSCNEEALGPRNVRGAVARSRIFLQLSLISDTTWFLGLSWLGIYHKANHVVDFPENIFQDSASTFCSVAAYKRLNDA